MKRWYVVQVYAGYEEHAKAELARRIRESGLEEQFGDILIPSAKVKQLFDVADGTEDQNLFPGYVLIEMESTPEAFRLVTTTPRISRFLGGQQPVPLSQREISRILGQMKGEVILTTERRVFEPGQELEINSGPFAGFVGIVDTVDDENEKLRVMVSIFGRMTPVELAFDQVKH